MGLKDVGGCVRRVSALYPQVACREKSMPTVILRGLLDRQSMVHRIWFFEFKSYRPT